MKEKEIRTERGGHKNAPSLPRCISSAPDHYHHHHHHQSLLVYPLFSLFFLLLLLFSVIQPAFEWHSPSFASTSSVGGLHNVLHCCCCRRFGVIIPSACQSSVSTSDHSEHYSFMHMSAPLFNLPHFSQSISALANCVAVAPGSNLVLSRQTDGDDCY